MAKVHGFEIAYTNRGSWKANRSIRGKVLDEIPVAWDKDYEAGTPPKLTIWFKNPREAELVFGRGSFVCAIAKKRPDSASSEDITNLLKVKPMQLVADENRPENGGSGGIKCAILERVTSAEYTR